MFENHLLVPNKVLRSEGGNHIQNSFTSGKLPRNRWDKIGRRIFLGFFVPNENPSGHRCICGIKTPSLVVWSRIAWILHTWYRLWKFDLFKNAGICLWSGFIQSWDFAVCLALLTIYFLFLQWWFVNATSWRIMWLFQRQGPGIQKWNILQIILILRFLF